jgi:hypothetical protein
VFSLFCEQPAAVVSSPLRDFRSGFQAVGNLSAVLRKLLHDGMMQSDILFRRPIGIGVNVKFVCQLLASGETRIEVKQLEQVDD